jgi:hypothetical protein
MQYQDCQLALAKLIEKKCPTLLVGQPGVGKSDMVAQAARAAGMDLLLSHPAVASPTDAKGLGFPDKKGEFAKFLPYGELYKAIEAIRPTVWFLDDLGQASAAVQASYMQLLLTRQVGEHKISPLVTFVAATNFKSDRAGVSGILEPVKSRFTTIIEVQPSLDSWVDWALESDVRPELIAFLRFSPDMLMKFEPTSGMENSPTPRTWSNFNKVLELGLDESLTLELGQGAVGKKAAMAYQAFVKSWSDLVSTEAILLDPENARIPDNPGTLHAVVSSLARAATPENFSRIYTYAVRMAQSSKVEFAAYLLRDSAKINPKVKATAAYVETLTGEFSYLFV